MGYGGSIWWSWCLGFVQNMGGGYSARTVEVEETNQQQSSELLAYYVLEVNICIPNHLLI